MTRAIAACAAIALTTLAASLIAVVGASAATSPASTSLPVQVTFNPNPSSPAAAVDETWTVPPGVTEVTFYVDGGAGGSGGQEGGTGGTGGTIAANFAVTPGQTYSIVVAGNGAQGASMDTGTGLTGGTGGGLGGGGGGAGSLQAPNYVGGGGGGGGESTIALASGGTPTTLLVAPGGGGGGGGNGSTLSGGAGGDGATAGTGGSSGAGGGAAGTDTQGGAAGMSTGGTFGAAGQASQGGAGASPAFGGGAGGGGAGAFGGGSGGGTNEGGGGGAGGSYFVATNATNVAMKTGAAAGQVAIGYATNAPPPPPPVTKVQPHPSISGVAAVGSPITCNPGVPVGAQATLSFQWLSDTNAIAGAIAAQYAPVAGDATHHLQCRVTASNSAGALSAMSSFVTVPAEGVPASVVETIIGRPRDRLGHPFVNVICSPQTPLGCTLTATATAVETLRGSTVIAVAAAAPGGCTSGCATAAGTTRRTITLGGETVKLASGQTRALSLPLTSAGTALLALRRRLPATLTVTGTLVGVFNGPLSSATLTLLAPASLKPSKPSKPGRSTRAAESARAAKSAMAAKSTATAKSTRVAR